MKKRLMCLGLSALLLASCAGGADSSSEIEDSTATSSWTITFDSKGGSAVASIKVINGQKAVQPSKPTKSGYLFMNWCVDEAAVTPFSWDTLITADWTLYASWVAASSAESSSSSSAPSSETSESKSSEKSSSSSLTSSEYTQNKGHGPDGSTLVDWYLCGSGSLWGADGWEKEGGIQLFSNPSSTGDKCCVLDISFKEGDLFKVTNGKDWYGFEKIKAEIETGLFVGVSDGVSGDKQNIKCARTGNYNIYVNDEGNIWLERAE